MIKQQKHIIKQSKPTKSTEPFFGKDKVIDQTKKALKKNKEQQNFTTLKHHIDKIANNKKTHIPAKQIVTNVQQAVEINPVELSNSKQNNAVVNAMDAAPTPSFDAKAYANKVIKNVEKMIPKDKESFDRDPTATEKVQEANAVMQDDLQKEHTNSTSQLLAASDSTSFETPAINTPAKLELEKVGIAEQPSKVHIKPTLQNKKENDLSPEANRIDQHLETHNISKNTLEHSKEATFINTVNEINESQANAAQTHQQYLKEAQPLAHSIANQNGQLINQKIGHIHQIRAERLNSIHTFQTNEKSNEEQIRTRVAIALNGIVNKTKHDVKIKLDTLSQTVIHTFELALSTANAIFESNVRRRTDVGILDKIANYVQGLPNDLKIVFLEEQKLFIERVRPTIENIGLLIDTTLQETKQMVADGRLAVDNYWKQQDEDTKKIAGDLFDNSAAQFDTLENDIENTNQSLQDEITTQFNKAVSTLASTFERIKEENKSWLEKAYDAVVEIVDAIIEMKNLLLNILSKAIAAIDKILEDPISFLKNILSAIKEGFVQFKDNILTHLKEGFINWLAGNIPGDIEIPKTWDAKGIFTFVASILGLTWNNIKVRAIEMYGPAIINALETAFEVFIIIKNEGIGGLWNYIKEQLSDLKDSVFNSIQEFLVEKVIKAGITWLISLFNPASAFIKACMLIYEVINWFIKNAKRLMNLINGIIDSVVDITVGNLKGASARIEKTLANTVPIVIGFLAGLLGLGDLSDKIKGIINKLRQPINKAIDWILKKAGDLVKGLLKAGKAGVEKIAGWLGLRQTYRSKDGHEHSLFFEEKDGKPILMRASVKQSFVTYMSTIIGNVDAYNVSITNAQQKIDFTAINTKYHLLLQHMADYNDFKKNEISKNLNELAVLLSKLPDEIGQNVNIFFPPNKSHFSTNNQDMHSVNSNDGKSISVTSLSLKLGSLRGSPGRHTSPLFKHIYQKIPDAKKGNLIRGHLLNHYLGGTGDEAKNIAPIAKVTNNKMERFAENKSNEKEAKKRLMSGSVFDYEVNVTYSSSTKFNANIPSNITMTTQDKKFNDELPRTKANMENEDNWKQDGAKIPHSFNEVQTELENLLT